MAFGELFTGAPGQFKQIGNFTPQQQQLQNQSIQQAMSLLGNKGKPDYSGFEPIEQRARQQFQTQTVPSLAERFTSLGGGQRSSAFTGALGQYGSDLESQLAGLRSQYGLQQQQLGNQQLGQLSNIGFQPSFQTAYQPATQGLLHQIVPALTQLLALLGGGALGGGLNNLSQFGGR